MRHSRSNNNQDMAMYIIDAVGFYLPDKTYINPNNGKNTTLRHSIFLSTASQHNTFSFACVQKKVVLVGCNALLPNGLYQYETELVGTNSKKSYTIPGSLVQERICPILGNKFPLVLSTSAPGNDTIQTKVATNLNEEEVRSLHVKQDENPTLFTSITKLQTSGSTQTPPQQLITPLIDSHSTSIKLLHKSQSNTDGSTTSSTLNCARKDNAKKLNYEAKPMEAFVCRSSTLTPESTVAMCGPDGIMHVANFVTELHEEISRKNNWAHILVRTFKVGRINEHYRCFTLNPVWVNYKRHAAIQKIPEDNMLIDTNIHQAFTESIANKEEMHIVACKKQDIKISLPCTAYTYFNQRSLTEKPPFYATKEESEAYQSMTQHPLTKFSQIGQAIDASHFMNDSTLQELGIVNCPPRPKINDPFDNASYTRTLLFSILSSFVAFFVIAVAAALACYKCNPANAHRAGKSRLNQHRQSTCIEEEVDMEMATTHSRTPKETEKDMNVEQDTLTPLTQSSQSEVQSCYIRAHMETQEDPQKNSPTPEYGTPSTTMEESNLKKTLYNGSGENMFSNNGII